MQAHLSRAHSNHFISSAPLQTGSVCSLEEISEAYGIYCISLINPFATWVFCTLSHLDLKVVSLVLVSFLLQLEQQHVLIYTDSMSVVSQINRQGRVHSRALFEQAACLLLWANRHLLSIQRNAYPRSPKPGKRNGISHREWRMHPSSVRMIRDRFRRVEVDLFTTSENTHCQCSFRCLTPH